MRGTARERAPRVQVVEVPARDWAVTRLTDRGGGEFYRYLVEGRNLNYPPCHPQHEFSWRVPRLDDRYDLSAVRVS